MKKLIKLLQQKRHGIYCTYLNLQSVSMKKIVIISILLSTAFPACKSKNSDADKKTPTYREVNVKNVNGNIPDTTNAIDLNTKKDSSSTRIDSSSQK